MIVVGGDTVVSRGETTAPPLGEIGGALGIYAG